MKVTDLVCVDYQKTPIRIGDEVTFCVHIYPRKLRMAFKLIVDKYSIVTITGCKIII